MNFKAFTKESQQKITDDWILAFPFFQIYKPMWLMKRNGPLVSGICLEMVAANTEYRPIMHVHNLCRRTGFMTLTLNQPVRDRHSWVHITPKSHSRRFEDTVMRLKEQALIPMTAQLRLDEIMIAYDRYLNFPFAQTTSRVFHYLDMVSLNVWCGRVKRAAQQVRRAEREAQRWDDWDFKNVGGRTAYVRELHTIIDNPSLSREIESHEAEQLRVETLVDYGLVCS